MERGIRLLKLLRYDIKKSLYQNRFRILGAATFFLFLVHMIEQYFQQMQVQIGMEGIYCYLIYGNLPYAGSGNNQFELPVIWILFHGYLLFLIGDYPIRDMNDNGEQVFLKIADRKIWWLEKCVWVVSVCTFYMVLFLVVGVTYLAARGKPMFMPLYKITEILGIQESVSWIGAAGVLHLLMLSCICLLQLVLSMRWNCLPSFTAILMLLVCSAYTNLSILPGNAMMLARTCEKQAITVNLIITFFMEGLYFSILCLKGIWLIKKYDIQRRK